jgi:hypothetical protein
MKYEKSDPWQEAVNDSGGIQGLLLKFARRSWTVDDEAVQTGDDGVRICILMETALHGSVLWSNDRTIINRRLNRYAAVAPSREPLENGRSPYTQFQCVGASGNYVGQLMTFSSSSWGGRHAFQALIRPYLQRGKREFPICTVGSRPKKNDVNGNFDPVFTIVGWAPRDDFAAILPPDDEPPPSSARAAPIDDDAPF